MTFWNATAETLWTRMNWNIYKSLQLDVVNKKFWLDIAHYKPQNKVYKTKLPISYEKFMESDPKTGTLSSFVHSTLYNWACTIRYYLDTRAG